MLPQRIIETWVGLFIIAAIAAFVVLAFKVSGLTSFFKPDTYAVTAEFDDIGQLKVRGAVKIAGVTIGEVGAIRIDPKTYRAVVTLLIHANVDDIPDDSSASILTAGLLGDNYIAITPMYSETFLKEGSQIEDTHPAMILEKLIGQLLFKLGNMGSDEKAPATTTTGEKK